MLGIPLRPEIGKQNIKAKGKGLLMRLLLNGFETQIEEILMRKN